MGLDQLRPLRVALDLLAQAADLVVDAAVEQGGLAAAGQIEELVAQMGPDFSAAWDIGDELDENSEDGQEFYEAVDTLAEKCQ